MNVTKLKILPNKNNNPNTTNYANPYYWKANEIKYVKDINENPKAKCSKQNAMNYPSSIKLVKLNTLTIPQLNMASNRYFI